jgi:hypothetical protein
MVCVCIEKEEDGEVYRLGEETDMIVFLFNQ